MLTRTVVEDDDLSLHQAVKENYASAWRCAEKGGPPSGTKLSAEPHHRRDYVPCDSY
jgi:hypothetical protein